MSNINPTPYSQLPSTLTLLNGITDTQMLILDREGIIIQFNDAWKAYILSNQCPDFHSKEIGVNYIQQCKEAANAGSTIAQLVVQAFQCVMGNSPVSPPIEYESNLSEKPTWFNITISRLEGEFDGFLVSQRDITAYKEASFKYQETHKAFKDEKAFFESIIEHIPIQVFVKDAEHLRFVRVNRLLEEHLGISRKELLGKTDFDFFPTAEAEFYTSMDREALKSGSIVDIPEEPNHTRHGKRILHTRKIPIVVDEENAKYVLGISEDITQKKEQENALKETLERVEKMSNFKSNLLANISHEFRTPLSAIIGFTDILLESKTASSEMTELNQIRMNGLRLLHTLDAFIELSQLESQSLIPSFSRFNLIEIVRTASRSFELEARNQNLGFSYLFPEQTDVLMIESDRHAVERICFHLLSNAIKFTRVGGIELSIIREDHGFMIQVKDSGIGISDFFMEQLFTPFHQESVGLSRVFEGSGLGLSITKGYLDLLGGRIDVHSQKNAGSTFTVHLPLEAPQPVAVSSTPGKITYTDLPTKVESKPVWLYRGKPSGK